VKRLLGVLLAVGLAVTVTADGTVVCTATPHSTGIEFSAATTSAAAGLQCDRPAIAGGGGGVDPRWDNLVAGWKLDESSDGSAPVPRADVLGVYELTDNNTTASAAGKIGNAASFVAANSESLSLADTDNVMDGGDRDLTYSLWIKTTTVTQQCIFAKSNSGGDHALFISAAGILRWEFTSFNREVQSAAAVNDGVWHHVVVWHDSSNGDLKLVVDDGAVRTTTGLVTYFTNDQAFAIGNGVVGNHFDGAVDEFYRWDTLIGADTTWRTDMYNADVGRSYPD